MDDQKTYLSIQEAANYIGVTPQTLRRWDAAGKLKPIRHRTSDYRFYNRVDLEPLRLEYMRAQMQAAAPAHFFQTITANIESNDRLREPQQAAHRKAREHFAEKKDPVILQLPVGCGKTGVIATLPFGISSGRVLVITPNLTIRKGVAEALDIASQKCFWLRTRVLSTFVNGPFCAVLDGVNANLHDCNESHFVVTNIQQLASSADRWLPQFPPNYFDMIIVDEGHHNAAPSWRKVFERFSDAKVVSLTATPFRSDQQQLEGEVIYRYPFSRAMMKGYIKQIHSINFAPAEIYFTYRGDPQRHSLEEVLKLREEQWFRKGVALAPECNRHIVEISIARCRSLREKTGVKHQIIAAACSVDHARQIRALFQQHGFEAREIHSDMGQEEQDEVLALLKQGRLDCIVQVQMLGEGFDHPPLSVAAVFRPFRSLSPYIQFVGRIMRVIHENEPGHPDNHGIIVSHIGLNNDEHWDDFRELDDEDQQIFHRWLTSEDEEQDLFESQGMSRRFDVGMQVQDEILSHFISRSFLDPDDDKVLEQLLTQTVGGTGLTLATLGVTKETLRAKLKQQQKELEEQPALTPPSPQRRRVTMQKRLFERTNSVVSRILEDLNLSAVGRDVGRVVSEVRGKPNRDAISRLLNRKINAYLGIGRGKRKDPSADQIEQAFNNLDVIGDDVRDRIKEVLN
jgi:superfamily II DNA or RNA helicase